ncbi:hypothetical protein RRG08_031963 [Elysia crispata]|uniref:Uncharacterized protein n=1 Tax=Elysia crispata TaxID=231223 RepID=A0AAE0Z4Z2_9GAST|nr:hypothetical protein RRG08_031963 [Elysia crispata]
MPGLTGTRALACREDGMERGQGDTYTEDLRLTISQGNKQSYTSVTVSLVKQRTFTDRRSNLLRVFEDAIGYWRCLNQVPPRVVSKSPENLRRRSSSAVMTDPSLRPVAQTGHIHR